MLLVESVKKEDRVCPHCGMKEKDLDRSMSGHMRWCQYEQMSCNCEATFKNPRDKHRHMMFYHSTNKYIKCEKCEAIFSDSKKGRSGLENHLREMHTTDGSAKVSCEVCSTSFQNLNRLRAHRLSHEVYFCQLCDKEVVGRNVFRAQW